MMFSIFKKKPRLFELIPSGFVDIHSHVLPGLDDGCKNMTQSIELIQEMQKLGFSELIATPHTMTGVWENTSEGIKESWNSLNDTQKLSMPLNYASEYLIDNNFLDRMQKGDLLCLNCLLYTSPSPRD